MAVKTGQTNLPGKVTVRRPADRQMNIAAALILLLAAAGAVFLFLKDRSAARVMVDVPGQDLAAFTQIHDDKGFNQVRMAAAQVSGDMLADRAALAGAYLIEPVKAGSVIRKSQVVIPAEEFKQNTSIVAVQVDAASAWNGDIIPGSIVTVWGKPLSAGSGPQAVPVVPKALALKAQKVEGSQPAGPSQNFIVMLAVPQGQVKDLAAYVLSAPVTLAPAQP